MPLTAEDIKEAEGLEEELRSGLEDASSPDYEDNAATYNSISRAIDDYYKGQRKTDDSGKLTAPPPTRLSPQINGNPDSTDYEFHFEPSVAEVQDIIRSRPDLVKQYKLEDWFNPKALKMRSLISGPPRPALDTMTSDSSPYATISNHLWAEASQRAKASGRNLKRYRDVPFAKGQVADYLKGALEYNISRRLAPIGLALADAYTMGAGSPTYDAYVEEQNQNADELERRDIYETLYPGETPEAEPVTDPMSGQIIPQAKPIPGRLPTSEEIKNRSPGLYHGANMLAYGLPLNPTNFVQRGVADTLEYLAQKQTGKQVGKALRHPLEKFIVAGTAGGVGNAAEGAVRDTARGLQEGKEWSEVAKDVGYNVPFSFATGSVVGAGGDLAAQGVGHLRERFRRQNPDIRTLVLGGGDTSFLHGTKPHPDVEEYVRQGTRTVPRPEGSPGALAAEDIAPKLEESLKNQEIANNERIGRQTEEYFNHPAYRDLKAKGTRLVQALVDMAKTGQFRAPVDETLGSLNPGLMNTVNKELESAPWAQARYVPREQSAALAAETGGVVVDAETVAQMFGVEPNFPQGYEAVIIPKDFTARELTLMEQKVDRILKMHSDGTAPADPVYEHFNQALKETRDDFPAWEDEAGNLVAPPVEEAAQQPFSRAGDAPPPPAGELKTYPPPIDVRGKSLDVPESRPGVGPGQPELPGTFDQRAPAQPSTPLEAMAAPQDVYGPPPPSPEGLMGVGPGQPDLPQNPFDPRLPVSRELLAPSRTVDVKGDYSAPDFVEPEALPGPGPRRDRPASVGEIQPSRPVDVRGGEYAEPERVYPDEPAPVTPRMPLGKPVGVPEEPRQLGDEETPLSRLAGNKLAMEVPEQTAQPTLQEKQAVSSASEGAGVRAVTGAEQQAFDEAAAQIRKAEERLGPMDEESKTKSLLGILSKKLGREVTKEDLVKAGLITGGAVASMSDDEDVQRAGIVASLIGGSGKGPSEKPAAGGKFPRQPEATLDNGKVVRGFSAMRRKQSQSKKDIASTMQRVGVNSEKTLRDRLIEFRQGNNKLYDDALEEEAKKLGLGEEVWRVPAAAQQVEMERNRAVFGGTPGRGVFGRVIGGASPRLDKLAGILSGAGRNPYERGPNGLMEELLRAGLYDPVRNVFNFSAGRLGARYGDDAKRILNALRDQINSLQPVPDDKQDKRKQEDEQ